MARWKTSLSAIHGQAFGVHEGVGSQAQPECLDPDHVAGGDVAQVHVRADAGHELGLEVLGGCLEQEASRVDATVQDVPDEVEAKCAVGAANATSAALAGLGDHK